MSRQDRAKQFAPFDALKGLQAALRMKEYEHDKMLKGDLPEEKIEEISKTLLNLTKSDVVSAKYFSDGYYKTSSGKAKVEYENQIIKIGNLSINFSDLTDLIVKK